MQPQGQLENAEDYKRLVIAERAGNIIRLGDVAKVVDSVATSASPASTTCAAGPPPRPSITLAVSRQPGTNTMEVAQAVRGLIPQLKAELPGSIDLIPTYDRSLTIIDSVNDVKETLFIAFVLVVLVIFVFLGRAADTLIPVVALPLSLLITFIVMQWLNYSIDNLSLLALTLAIGFLVDDAIVFLENCVRRMDTYGESPLEAALAGAQEISFTILSMTLSLAAVFIPLVFMPGVLGLQFREFAIVIIVAIVASGLVSLTLTPLMCSRLLDGHASGKKTWMERKIQAVMSRVVGAYGRTLHVALPTGGCRSSRSSSASSPPSCFSARSAFRSCRWATAASPAASSARPRARRRNPCAPTSGPSRPSSRITRQSTSPSCARRASTFSSSSFSARATSVRPSTTSSPRSPARLTRSPGCWLTSRPIRCCRFPPARPTTARENSPTRFPASTATRSGARPRN